MASVIALGILLAGIIIDLVLVSLATNKPPNWNFLIRRIEARSWALIDIGILFASFFVIMMCLLLASSYLSEDAKQSPLFLIPQMAALPITAICGIAFVLNSRQISIRHAFGVKRSLLLKHIKQGMICYLAIMPFVMIASLIYMQILTKFGIDVGHQPVIEILVDPMRPTWIQLTIVLLAVISAPLIEELFFRGLMLPLALGRMSPLLAVLFVSILFAAIHMHLPALVPIMVLAIGLSAGYIATGSMVVPIVAHATFNTVSISVLILMKDAIL